MPTGLTIPSSMSGKILSLESIWVRTHHKHYSARYRPMWNMPPVGARNLLVLYHKIGQKAASHLGWRPIWARLALHALTRMGTCTLSPTQEALLAGRP